MEQAHPTGCLNTKKSAKIPLSSKKMVLSLTATFTAGNFPGQIYFYTAGFELFGRGHGHLATLVPGSPCRTGLAGIENTDTYRPGWQVFSSLT
jgi:hypothetical protein